MRTEPPADVGEKVEPGEAMAAGHEQAAPSGGGRALGIGRKIVALVVLSALVPAVLVGTVSYFLARGVLTENIHARLAARLADAQEHLDITLAERAQDTEIFASAFVVEQSLALAEQGRSGADPTAASEWGARLQSYLDGVRERYPLYRELAVVDRTGELVAYSDGDESADWLAAVGGEVQRGDGLSIQFLDDRPTVVAWSRVGDMQGSNFGALVSVSRLEALWQLLGTESTSAADRLLILDHEGQVLFDSQPSGEPPHRAASHADGVGEYRDESGTRVLGAWHRLAGRRLVMIVEIEAARAFMAVHRMRTLMLVISVLAAILVAAVAARVALGMVRPIGALIRGARSASRGDLSGEIPVTSSDQIGELTRTFNRMVHALRDSRDKLERLSVTDELTGLYNRRYLRQIFDKELHRATRSGEPLSLLMLDLDHFKAYNDRLGHLKGDAYLRGAASLLAGQLRTSDILSRYGGEEFVVLLPATAKKTAAEIAERVRQRFDDGRSDASDRPRVTISGGVATYPDDGATKEELLTAADEALYAAKRQGRNRVVLAPAARKS